MIKTLLISLAGCLAGQFLFQPAIAQDAPLQQSRVKTSLNAFSFNRALLDHIEDPAKGISISELFDFCAANRFDAVDLTGYYFHGYPNVPHDSVIYAVKRKAFLNGLEISGTGVRNDFAQTDPVKRAADVQLVKNWIDVAAKLGAPVIRIFAGKEPAGFENKWDSISHYVVESARECASYGQEKGVIVGIQNHGDFLKTADQTLRIVEAVNSEWFGVVADIGSFITTDPYRDIAMVMPKAVNFQFKERIKTAAGEQVTDVARVLNIVKRSGYRGYLPIETLADQKNATSYDPEKQVPAFLDKIRKEMKKIYREN